MARMSTFEEYCRMASDIWLISTVPPPPLVLEGPTEGIVEDAAVILEEWEGCEVEED